MNRRNKHAPKQYFAVVEKRIHKMHLSLLHNQQQQFIRYFHTYYMALPKQEKVTIISHHFVLTKASCLLFII